MNFIKILNSMLNKGAKVLCLDDGIKPERLLQISEEFPNWIESKKEYTIRQVYAQVNTKTNEMVVSILLEEIHNPPIWIDQYKAMIEPGFALERFAIIVDKAPKLDLGHRSN